ILLRSRFSMSWTLLFRFSIFSRIIFLKSPIFPFLSMRFSIDSAISVLMMALFPPLAGFTVGVKLVRVAARGGLAVSTPLIWIEDLVVLDF
ncbi:hypothetical protein BGX38DRAFT_1183867, partial [Terfezia claveryi]